MDILEKRKTQTENETHILCSVYFFTWVLHLSKEMGANACALLRYAHVLISP